MEPWMQALIVAFGAIGSSSGLWAWVQRKGTRRSAETRLLMGIAYEKIIHLGVEYIERGWISKDEYEEFRRYLFEPYKDLGGNGVAERIMIEVGSLPIRSHTRYAEINRKEQPSEKTNYEHH